MRPGWIAGASLLLLASCASKPIYYWGHYERVLYRSMVSNQSPIEQIEALNKDVAEAKRVGLPLPPGFHAHLGFLYSEVGSTQLALNQFQMEKKEFPESATLMDRFLGHSKKNKQKGAK